MFSKIGGHTAVEREIEGDKVRAGEFSPAEMKKLIDTYDQRCEVTFVIRNLLWIS